MELANTHGLPVAHAEPVTLNLAGLITRLLQPPSALEYTGVTAALEGFVIRSRGEAAEAPGANDDDGGPLAKIRVEDLAAGKLKGVGL